MAQQALKTGLSTSKIWVYSFLRSVLVPDQWWSTNFYCSNWNMRKPIYNRWWRLFTAIHSEAWAEGKASPGRSMGHVLWVCHFQEAETHPGRTVSWGSALGLHICRRHTLGFYVACRLVESILAWFVAAIAFAPNQESLRKSEVLKFLGRQGKQKTQLKNLKVGFH